MEIVTAEEVEQALTDWLGPDGRVEVSRDGPQGRITGWVMHPDFTGVSRATRQSWLWDGFAEEGELQPWAGLRGTFNKRATQIGLMLTYSPSEFENAMGKSA